jgi:lipopolysaccharide export system protein LptC
MASKDGQGATLALVPGAGPGVDRLTVLQLNDSGTHAFSLARRIDGGRGYRRAVRHSRHVRLLRVGIPLVIVLGGFAAFVVLTWLDPLRALAKLPVDIGGLVVSGTKITMQQPRLVGFTRDARSYTVNASAAAQDVTRPDMLELQNIHATMEMQDKSIFNVVARNGLYDTKAEKLTLRQDIVVTSTNYEGLLSEAVIEVRNGSVVSERPVELKMLQGTVNANRMEVVNSGSIVRFDGGVTMVLTLDSSPGKAAQR